MFSVIYITIGPILIMTGAILIFYTFASKWRKGVPSNLKKKKTHIIECEQCSKKLRVPTIEGTLKVTCPDCTHVFNHG